MDPETVPSARRRVRRRWPVAALVLLLVVAIALDQRAQLVAQWRALVVLSVSLQTTVARRPDVSRTDPRRAPAACRASARAPSGLTWALERVRSAAR